MLNSAWPIIRHEARYQFSKHIPRVFLRAHQLKYNAKKRPLDYARAVSHETEIVIEGFPRSANTFVVRGFTLAQNRPVPIAHHLHLPVNIIQGIQMDIPCLVLVRRPIDAIISVASWRVQRLKHEKNNKWYSDTQLKWILELSARHWIRFYETILPLRDKFLLIFFEEAIADLGYVIKKFNDYFGVDYLKSVHQSTVKNKIIHDHGPLYSPSEEREAIKERIAFLAAKGKAARVIEKAENFYELWFKK